MTTSDPDPEPASATALTFSPLAVDGAWLIVGSARVDERGSFARLFSTAALAEQGLETRFVETSLSTNVAAHTLRGLHWQAAPHEEVKLVRCVRGAIYDVVLDVRAASRTFGVHAAVELRAGEARTVYVPSGCAHGFLTLVADSDVEYAISTPYAPASARGVRWDDAAFQIAWPAAPAVVSPRDLSFPPWSSAARAKEAR